MGRPVVGQLIIIVHQNGHLGILDEIAILTGTEVLDVRCACP